MEFPRRCGTPAEMRTLGRELGRSLPPGSVLALDGELGAGKTELVKGLADALGHRECVTSPTFTLLNEYRGGVRPVFHFDFYRLEAGAEVVDLAWDELLEQEGTVVVEWASRFADLFPSRTIWLQIEADETGTRVVTRAAGPSSP